MSYAKHLLRLTVLSMLVALGVVISPILRVEGMCPMAHFINIICSVFLGPWYSLLCATLIGIIRMATMGIPPIALTGAVFGAFLSGAVMSYPVMTLLWGKEGLSWLFYVPSFICGTLIGGSIAYVFLRKIASNGMLTKIQIKLNAKSYVDKSSLRSDSLTIAAFGAILFVVVELASSIFELTGYLWDILSYAAFGVCILIAIVYYLIKKVAQRDQ